MNAPIDSAATGQDAPAQPSPLRILVVDDEPLARKRLRRLLGQPSELGPCTVEESEDGVEAERLLRSRTYDAVLLDIRMPGLDGLTLAMELTDGPPIIFVTAYDEYAVRAFEARAIDYLLKPVSQERLAEALRRVRARQAETTPTSSNDATANAANAANEAEAFAPRVVVHDGTASRFFDASDITRFHASDKYTLLCVDGREHLLEESLSQLEKRLGPIGFFRCHRAELINLGRVRALHQTADGTSVELDDGQLARVSRRHLASLKARLGA